MLQLFDIVLLRTFVSVARHLNFTSAAAELHLSQSTVSKHISALELAVGRRLLDRDTRSMSLTVDGFALLGFAREILATQEAASAYFRRGAEPGHLLRLGIRDGIAFSWMPEVLTGFREACPSVVLEVYVGTDPELTEHLRIGRIDVAFMISEGESGRSTMVARDRMVWAHHPRLDVRKTDTIPVVAYGRDYPGNESIFRSLDAGNVPWQISCVPHDPVAMLASVRAGLGIALWPRTMIPDGVVEASSDLGLPTSFEFGIWCVHNPGVDAHLVGELIAATQRYFERRTPDS